MTERKPTKLEKESQSARACLVTAVEMTTGCSKKHAEMFVAYLFQAVSLHIAVQQDESTNYEDPKDERDGQ